MKSKKLILNYTYFKQYTPNPNLMIDEQQLKSAAHNLILSAYLNFPLYYLGHRSERSIYK